MVKSPYIIEKLSDFDEIWRTTADLELDVSEITLTHSLLRLTS